jgi:DNA phosphorothioation-dependent restriction protein DptG
MKNKMNPLRGCLKNSLIFFIKTYISYLFEKIQYFFLSKCQGVLMGLKVHFEMFLVFQKQDEKQNEPLNGRLKNFLSFWKNRILFYENIKGY